MNATRTYQSLAGDEVKAVLKTMITELAERLDTNPGLAPHLSWPALCAEVKITVSSPDVLKPVSLVAQLGPVHTPDDVRIAHNLAIPELTQSTTGIVEKRTRRGATDRTTTTNRTTSKESIQEATQNAHDTTPITE